MLLTWDMKGETEEEGFWWKEHHKKLLKIKKVIQQNSWRMSYFTKKSRIAAGFLI
jgi:hypothetical protein